MNPAFSDVLFGPGQPFDITRFYIILPDDIGQGESSKPSDSLRMHFPQYDYDDMVASQHTMLVQRKYVQSVAAAGDEILFSIQHVRLGSIAE
jgi:homoserine O-acetyltransferase